MDNIKRVEAFHRTFKCLLNNTPAWPNEQDTLLRLQLITEETSELIHAIAERNMVAVLDALTDLSYVVDGTWLAFGLQDVRHAAMEEVHDSNMTKLDHDGKPIFNDAGRVVKGPNYRKPDLEQILLNYLRQNRYRLSDLRAFAGLGDKK